MRVVVMVLLLASLGCEAVPDVTYSDGDAGFDGCPNQVPSYATSCCGPIPCFGSNCAAAATDCIAKCSVLDLCCPNAQDQAVCKRTLVCQ
jgi:hypothetical protein